MPYDWVEDGVAMLRSRQSYKKEIDLVEVSWSQGTEEPLTLKSINLLEEKMV
jgi:hypothetical protein